MQFITERLCALKTNENNMKNFKVWLVEAKKRKVYPFFEGKKRVTANDLNDLSEFRRKLQNENPNDFWAVCTNE